MSTAQTAPTQYIHSPTTDVTYAYRRFGGNALETIPLLFNIHVRGTMDHWDPLLINRIASQRPVILFDNAGVGKSSGEVATSVREAARHARAFLAALKITRVDVLGFSMGGYIATLTTLDAEDKGLVRKLIIAGSGPSSAGEGGSVMTNGPERTAKVMEHSDHVHPPFEAFGILFYAESETSQTLGKKAWDRIHERSEKTSGEERSKFVSEGMLDEGRGLKNQLATLTSFMDPEKRSEGSWDRLKELTIPVLIGQGHDDFMIPTINSFVMQQALPNAKLVVYPDSGHGFLFQYAKEFADEVNRFLGKDEHS